MAAPGIPKAFLSLKAGLAGLWGGRKANFPGARKLWEGLLLSNTTAQAGDRAAPVTDSRRRCPQGSLAVEP